jgi:hypothetical protein
LDHPFDVDASAIVTHFNDFGATGVREPSEISKIAVSALRN